MAKHKFLRCLMAVGLGGLISLSPLGFNGSGSMAQEVVAQPVKANDSESSLRQGLPGRRLGGGTRAPEMSAYNNQQPLAALIPESNLSVTTSAHPTLLFHLPVIGTSQAVEFVLYNSEDELLYETQFSVTGQSGVVGIDLAGLEKSGTEEGTALAIDETYKWYLTIVADDRAQDISVDGWIQRVALNDWIQQQALDPKLSAQLEIAPPLEQVRLLAEEANLWSDAALVLHQLRKTEPQNQEIASAWQHLLQAEGLQSLSEEPIAELSMVPLAE